MELTVKEVDGNEYVMDIGRIGPGAAVGECITQCKGYFNEVHHKESVIAMSMCTAYVMAKYDFFYRVPDDVRLQVTQCVYASYAHPPATHLYDNTVVKMGEHEWRVKKTWDAYKHMLQREIRLEIRAKKENKPVRRTANIINNFNDLRDLHLSNPRGNLTIPEEPLVTTSTLSLLRTHKEDLDSVGSGSAVDSALSAAASSNGTFTRSVKFSDDHDTKITTGGRFNRQQRRGGVLLANSSSTSDNNSVNSKIKHGQGSCKRRTSMMFVSKFQTPDDVATSSIATHSETDRPPFRMSASVTCNDYSDLHTPTFTTSSDHLRRSDANPEGDPEEASAISLVTSASVAGPTETHKSSVVYDDNDSFDSSIKTTSSISGINSTRTRIEEVPMGSKKPFALVQYHRDSLHVNESYITSSKRPVAVYMRLCGTMDSCHIAKKAAEVQMMNVRVHYRGPMTGSVAQDHDLSLTWRPFVGYASLPMHHMDHFIVLCRSAPIAFASFSAHDIDLLNGRINEAGVRIPYPFPAACKVKQQAFVCAYLTYTKSKHFSTDGMMDGSSTSSPTIKDDVSLFLRELSVVDEVQYCASSRRECLRLAREQEEAYISVKVGHVAYAHSKSGAINTGGGSYTSNYCTTHCTTDCTTDCTTHCNTGGGSYTSNKYGASSAVGEVAGGYEQKRLCVLPLYTWILVSDEVLEAFNATKINAVTDEQIEKNKSVNGFPHTDSDDDDDVNDYDDLDDHDDLFVGMERGRKPEKNEDMQTRELSPLSFPGDSIDGGNGFEDKLRAKEKDKLNNETCLNNDSHVHQTVPSIREKTRVTGSRKKGSKFSQEHMEIAVRSVKESLALGSYMLQCAVVVSLNLFATALNIKI